MSHIDDPFAHPASFKVLGGRADSPAQEESDAFFDIGRVVEKIEEEQTARMKALLEVSRRMNATLDEEELLPFMMDRLLELMQADHGHLVLLTSASDEAASADASRGWEIKVSMARVNDQRTVALPPSQTLIRAVIEARRPLRLDDALSDDFIKDSKSAHELGLRSVMAVPLVTRDRLIGVLSVENRGRFAQFNEEHLDFLQVFGHQAAVAIENARLYRSLRDAQAQLSKAHKALRLEMAESQQALQSERQRLDALESEVRHLDKMAAMGMMVSGIAHELNNPLTGALGFAQMLSLADNLSPRQMRMLSHITSEMTRCAEIIRNLLNFSRKDKMKRLPIDLNQLIREAIDLRRYQFEVSNVVMSEHFDPNVGTVSLDHFQFKGVILNMLNNAFDAIKERHGQGWISVASFRERDGGIRIEVTDNGGGIKELEKVFDPFYTTKEVGKGTGLGMSVAFGVVRSHGGSIQAANTEAGARITIHLPADLHVLDRETAPIATPAPNPSPGSPVGARLLVVDDEAVIRELCQALLEGEGYSVDLACDGQEAKEMLREKSYDLVITDIRMPGAISGVDLFRWIEAEYPSLAPHVLFITGDLMTKDVREALGEVGSRLLAKPFDVSLLLSSVREHVG